MCDALGEDGAGMKGEALCHFKPALFGSESQKLVSPSRKALLERLKGGRRAAKDVLQGMKLFWIAPRFD